MKGKEEKKFIVSRQTGKPTGIFIAASKWEVFGRNTQRERIVCKPDLVDIVDSSPELERLWLEKQREVENMMKEKEKEREKMEMTEKNKKKKDEEKKEKVKQERVILTSVSIKGKLDERASMMETKMYRYIFKTQEGVEGCLWVPKGNPGTLEDAPDLKVKVELSEMREVDKLLEKATQKEGS